MMDSSGNISEWLDELSGMSGKDRRREIAERIASAPEFDEESKSVWFDSVSYMERLVEQGKPFDTDLFKTYLDIRGHNPLDHDQMTELFTLLVIVGFEIEEIR